MTSTETKRVSLPKGGQAAADRLATDKENRKSNSFSFNDWEYLNLEKPAEGETIGGSGIYRFVTDEPDWVEAKKHSFLVPKPAPKDTPPEKVAKWPKHMDAVCRHSRGFDQIYDECFICDHTKDDKGKRPYAGLRLLALAVEREEVEVDGEVTYIDKTVEKKIFKDGKDTGETEKIKKFVVAEFGLQNFFDKLIGFKNIYKTVLDRDYSITRVGSGTETDYRIVPLDVVFADDGKKYDLRRPEIAALYENNIDLQKIFEDKADDYHYERFFDTRVEASYAARRDGTTAPAEEENAPSTEEAAASKATVDAMRQRLLDKAKKN